ncbi:CRISPR-associated helicase Cas3, subtype Dpsyc [Rothia kristinae]|nr:CRISPR-associated helicase Cas3, subtype Dpsyc [Rothia kristinae]SQC36782.1 CRISPR-associated helicase Cas3, subtype Dpsyc [Rothia kristinae]
MIGRTLPRLDQNLDPGLQGEVVDAAYQLLHQLEYEDQEIYPSTPARVRAVLTRKGMDPVHQAWVQRDGEWTLLRPGSSEGLPHAVAASGFPLRGGDLVVLDAAFPCTLGISADEAAGAQGPGTVLLPEGDRPIGDHSHPEALGVWTFLHQIPAVPADQETEETRICRAAGEAEPDEDGRIAVEDLPLRDGLPEGAYDVLLGPVIEATEGEPAWVTCTIRREAVQDERLALSEGGQDPEPVLLEDHQEDVAVRAKALGELLALPPFVRDALREAGLKHDAGKKTSAFQTRLFLGGNHRGEGLSTQERGDFRKKQRKMSYAKSEGLLPLSRTQSDPVPKGWRHEMVSAAMFWADQTVGNPAVLPETAGQTELTAWLIGTHHGLGRCGFPVGVAQLLGVLSAEERQDGVEEAVRLLYGVGLWEDLAALMERTFGPWGASYLEALLRAADVTISQEGR